MPLNSGEFSPRSALAYRAVEGQGQVATAEIVDLGVVEFKGLIKRVLFAQRLAGVAGTSISIALKRKRGSAAAVDVFATAPILTLASGDGACVDTHIPKDAVATPAGCTKPVLSATPANLLVQPGDILWAIVTLVGAYATNPATHTVVLVKPRF